MHREAAASNLLLIPYKEQSFKGQSCHAAAPAELCSRLSRFDPVLRLPVCTL
jgi:hypothetical protein